MTLSILALAHGWHGSWLRNTPDADADGARPRGRGAMDGRGKLAGKVTTSLAGSVGTTPHLVGVAHLRIFLSQSGKFAMVQDFSGSALYKKI